MPWHATGGPVLLADLFQFLFGALVLVLGAAPILHLVLLAGWLVLAAGLVRRLYQRLVDWADARLALTDELVERMVGLSNPVAQQPAAQQQEGADQGLAVYGRKQAALDSDMHVCRCSCREAAGARRGRWFRVLRPGRRKVRPWP